MSIYSEATKEDWFEDDYLGAAMNLTSATMVLCIHTTEGLNWPGYGGGKTAPNLTGFPPLKNVNKGSWRQHFSDERSARALENDPGGVQTNTMNVFQVELIGTCDPKHRYSWNGQGQYKAGVHYVYWPEADDGQLRWVAKMVADRHKKYGLRLYAPKFKAYPGSYGSNGVRLSGSQWRRFAGILGHQHVPENAHGDPGNIPIAKIIQFTKEILEPKKGGVPLPTSKPDWKINWETKSDLDIIQGQFQIQQGIREGTIKQYMGTAFIQNALVIKNGADLKIDGICGPKTVEEWRKWENKVGGTGRAGTPDPVSLKFLGIYYRFVGPEIE